MPPQSDGFLKELDPESAGIEEFFQILRKSTQRQINEGENTAEALEEERSG